MRIKTILALTDCDADSLTGLRFAAKLSAEKGAKLVVGHVLIPRTLDPANVKEFLQANGLGETATVDLLLADVDTTTADYANFSIAVNRRYKVDEQWKEETDFFDIVVFGKQAENCSEYLRKGRPVLVDGRLQQRRWETDEGQKRSKVEVVAMSVQFLGSRGGQDNARPASGGEEPPEFDDSDIPF